MNSTASQSSTSGSDGFSLCMPRSSLVPTRPMPKYACQTRLTMARPVVGALRSPRQRVQEARYSGVNALDGIEEIAALKNECLPRLIARLQNELRRSFRMLPPQSFDLFVLLFPLGDGGSPEAEHLRDLGGRAPVAR